MKQPPSLAKVMKRHFLWATIVAPTEYDVDAQMVDLVKQAHKEGVCWIDIDVGKLVGLYLAWKEATGK